MKLNFQNCAKIVLSAFALYLCVHYWPAVSNLVSVLFGAAFPLILGGAVAYVVNILMSFYEGHYFPKSKSAFVSGSRRAVCMLGAFLTVIAAVVLLFWLIIPQLGSCFQVIVAGIPGVIDGAIEILDDFEIIPEDILAYLEELDWKNILTQLVQIVKSGLGNVMDVVVSTVSNVASAVVTGVMAVIFSIYLLMGKERLGGQFRRVLKRYLKESWYEKFNYLLCVVNDCFHSYIVGQCTEAVIIGVLCAIGMAALQLPYAAMVGTLVGFTALIPVAGAYIGAAVGAFMILTVDPFKAVIFLIFLVILQQLEGNIIYPRVVGSSMGLPGIWVLSAVTLGGGIMGIGGMLLGVPLAAAAYRIVRDDVNKHLPPEVPEETAEETKKT